MSDDEQQAEETGHKRRKAQQVDLQGEEVDVAEGWTIGSPQTAKLHSQALEISKKIAQFKHIQEDTIQCVIAHKEKRVPQNKKENAHMMAECIKVRPVFVAIAEAQQATVGPFVIVFYPPFFKQSNDEREQTIIHELYHIKFNENSGKLSMRPHAGWGDSDIEKLHRLIKA
jgi:predicted metallopeptidase